MWLRVGMTGDDDDGGSLESIGSRHPSANTSQCRRRALLFRISGETAGGSRLPPGAKAIKRDAPPPEFLGSGRMGPENKVLCSGGPKVASKTASVSRGRLSLILAHSADFIVSK